MKRIISLLLIAALLLCGCQSAPAEETTIPETVTPESTAPQQTVPVFTAPVMTVPEDCVDIILSDEGVACDSDAVYTANDIVYYEAGHDFTYGEGTVDEEHSADEAAAHTVVHITQPGAYRISGKLSAGQIAVDLGDEAEDDPTAVVTLVLDGVDITCTVAPAVIFYNVYECGDTDDPTNTVDTTAAGANVILAEGSENTVNGSHVARIYKDGTQELSEDGTEVLDAKKLHKYDAAFYSKMSMNVGGSGKLEINADNEGLDAELHLTINGGDITIRSGNDGINTNEDGVSVTTVNAGSLHIYVTGTTGEGDGIDSNGWLVINGGTVIAEACSISGDAGIDSDMGIHINGGTVLATGNMLDQIADSAATYAVFSFASQQPGGAEYTLKNESGEAIITLTPGNAFSYLIIADPALTPGIYTFWQGDTQLAGSSGGMMGMGGMMVGFGGQMTRPEGMELPEGMEGMTPPQGMEDMTPPEGMEMPEGMEFPEGMEGMTTPDGEIPTMPEGEIPTMPEGETFPQDFGGGDRGNRQSGGFGGFSGETSTDFVINQGGNQFSMVAPAE